MKTGLYIFLGMELALWVHKPGFVGDKVPEPIFSCHCRKNDKVFVLYSEKALIRENSYRVLFLDTQTLKIGWARVYNVDTFLKCN
jgi:hypothetical protein